MPHTPFQECLYNGLSENLYSAAQLVIAQDDDILLSLAVGSTRSQFAIYDKNIPVLPISPTTLFDIASLTKPLATASLVMKAIDEGVLRLDQKLVSIQGIHCPHWLLSNTIQDLLCHQTPLPAWADFTPTHLEDRETTMQTIEHKIEVLGPRSDDATWCYSDLGYILLGFILEKAYQMPLNALFVEKITAPLQLESQLLYVPLHHVDRTTIAATKRLPNAYLQGHPDDDNARTLFHIAGHAGLFSNALTISRYVMRLVQHQFPVSPTTIQHFLHFKSPLTPFTLGWDRPTSQDSLSARLPTDLVIGHLGFTGCSVWVDLETHRVITLLTNRTHTNDNPKSLSKIRRTLYQMGWNL